MCIRDSNVTDGEGNPAAERTRTVNVVDNTDPVITMLGASPVTVECGDTYTDDGATALDACDGDLTAAINTVSTVDVDNVGNYTVTYNVTDGEGNAAAPVVRQVNVVDTTAPVITLIGSDPMTVNLDDPYTDPGATAADDCDGDLSASIVIGGDTVDTSTVDTYVVTYNVSDGASNAATEVTRTVNVVDTNNPFVTGVVVEDNLNILVTFNKEMGAGVTDAANYTLSGLGAGTLPANPDSVALDSGNTYRLTWLCPGLMLDGESLTVTVADTVEDIFNNLMGDPKSGTAVAAIDAPVISLLGDDPATVECGDTYTDAGATAADACGADLTGDIVAADDVNLSLIHI